MRIENQRRVRAYAFDVTTIGRPRLLSPIEEKKVAKSYQNGTAVVSLARQFGLSTGGIYKVLCRQGIARRSKSGAIKAEQKGNLRECVDCKIFKSPDEFPREGKYLANYCKSCRKMRYPYLYTQEAYRDKQLRKFYRITLADYKAIEKKQKGKCAICKKSGQRALAVDHNHRCCAGRKSCGVCIRGLLCVKCNRMLGLAGDDIRVLRKAIEYLESSLSA